MKAIQLLRYGHPDKCFKINEVPEPVPAENEVLIKVEFSGLNFADVVARRGLYPEAPKNPAVLGYDVVGTIEKINAKDSRFKIGDRVVALTRFGGYAEKVATRIEGVALLPDNIDHAKATALATQACTAYYASAYLSRLREGDNVLVHAAAGGVGSLICQIAKSKNCTVFGTASPSKHEYLKSIGVDHCIDYRNNDFYSQIKSILGGHAIDHAFDSVGGKTFRKSYKLLGPCGNIVSFGAADQIHGNNKLKAILAAIGFGIFSPIQYLMLSKSLKTVNMLKVADHKPALFNHILNQVMLCVENDIIEPKLDSVYNYQNIAEAHTRLESRKSIGKIVLDWTK